MRLLSNLHVKGKPAVLPDRAIRGQSHYFIYRPCMLNKFQNIYTAYSKKKEHKKEVKTLSSNASNKEER